MAEETKSAAPPPEGDRKPEAGNAAPPSVNTSPAQAPAGQTAPSVEKPAAPAAPHRAAAPAKPAGPVPVPWESTMITKLRNQFGSGVEGLSYLGQNYMQVDRSLIPDILQILRDEEQFDYCVDITAVHYPKRERQFDIIWILYSFARNERIRVKTQIVEGDHIPSAVSIWVGANWLEREAYDMFGIQFDGHPELKRILLPDGWKGHPLRKDYGIIEQDSEWVQINLGIESGQ